MKRLLFLLLTILSLAGFSQGVPISSFPTLTGDAPDMFIPAIRSGSNVKVSPATVTYRMIDSLSTSAGTTYDTIHVWKHGVKVFYKLVRAGSGTTISLTTTGTSGPATLIGSVLNIPQYTGGSGSSDTTVVTVDESLVYGIGNVLGVNLAYLGLWPNKMVTINDANYTLADDVGFVVFTTLSAARTLTLPAASARNGHVITIRNGGNGSFNVNLSTAVTSNAATTITTIAPNNWLSFKSNGINYIITGQ